MNPAHTHPNQMTNSHLLVNGFDYYEPASLAETFDLLQQYGPRARLMAGGTILLVSLKMESEAPEAIISLSHLPGFHQIEARSGDGALVIGAGASLRSIFASPLVRSRYPALAEACASFGSAQVQNMGTLGGNICCASPAADAVPALLVLDAQLQLASAAGFRLVRLEDFLLDLDRIDLRPGELLHSIILPNCTEGATSHYVKISRVASDVAKASIAVSLRRDEGRFYDVRIAMGSVAPTVRRLYKAEALLNGQEYSEELLLEAGRIGSTEISPIDDVRSEAWYRRELGKALVYDAVLETWSRCCPTWTLSYPLISANGRHHSPTSRSLHADELAEITLIVNNRSEHLRVAPNELLLNVLRERLELTGAKYGCGVGECGACTVLIDGRPALACLTLAVAADGHEISTVEGLQDPHTGALDPLQQAFIDESAFQCGYCTPGMLMATKALLNELPHPSERDVREYLKGNRCRCTGYVSILRAVLKAVTAETQRE